MKSDHTAVHARRPRTLSFWVLLGATLLAACGSDGSDGSELGDGGTELLGAAAHIKVTSALLDDEGAVMPADPRATPADAGARTRAGRYATVAQAEQLERAMTTAAIGAHVDSSGDAVSAAALAVLTVHGLQAAHGLDQQVPVLVRGADLRRAAVVSNQLQDHGYTRVFLVTP